MLARSIILTAVFMLAPMHLRASEKTNPRHVTLNAKASWLSDALKDRKIVSDHDLSGFQIVLVDAEGTITPILRDEASRALFLDEQLRNCDLEVEARKFAGLPYLQVVLFRVRFEGKWRIPEYYCDICTISVRYPQVCPCCQGPMEYRMKPLKD